MSLSFVDAVLGAVEGLTESLPVSSTGHLTVAASLLRIDGEAADSYVIGVQLGAIAAVALLYRSRIGEMFAGHRGGRLAGGLALAFLPAALLELLLGEVIKGPLVRCRTRGRGVGRRWRGDRCSGAPAVRGCGRTRVAGVARSVALIGVAQAVALWPGMSRSLVTILAALAIGLSVAAAVEFSFLLGLVTFGAGTAYEAVVNGSSIVDQFGVVMPGTGVVVAFLTAAVSMHWMVRFLEPHSLAVFGVYRLAAAATAMILLSVGIL